MKLDRREFITLVGASVSSSSTDIIRPSGRQPGPTDDSRTERLAVTGDAERGNRVFHGRELELINRRPENNRPAVVVGGMRQYLCERPSVARQDGSRLVFRYDFSGQDNFSVNYELEFEDLPQGMAALKQKVGIQAPKKIMRR